MDDMKDEKHLQIRPGSGDGATLSIAIYSKNAYGIRASVVVVKAELLLMRSKD